MFIIIISIIITIIIIIIAIIIINVIVINNSSWAGVMYFSIFPKVLLLTLWQVYCRPGAYRSYYRYLTLSQAF